MEQTIELLTLSNDSASVEKVVEEFIRLGMERWGEGLAGMVEPLREAIVNTGGDADSPKRPHPLKPPGNRRRENPALQGDGSR